MVILNPEMHLIVWNLIPSVINSSISWEDNKKGRVPGKGKDGDHRENKMEPFGTEVKSVRYFYETSTDVGDRSHPYTRSGPVVPTGVTD